MMASYFWVGSISYNSWMPNKLVCRIMVIGSTPPVFMGCFSQLPLYKSWGGTSFFMFLSPCGRRARNYEIRSLDKNLKWKRADDGAGIYKRLCDVHSDLWYV